MQALIDRVIEEIKNDILAGDLTAIDALLTFVPKENLIAFLPEEEWERFENDYSCDNCGENYKFPVVKKQHKHRFRHR